MSRQNDPDQSFFVFFFPQNKQTHFFAVVEVLSECCLLSYMARVENRLSFLFRLINIINVQTLTQVRNFLLLLLCCYW